MTFFPFSSSSDIPYSLFSGITWFILQLCWPCHLHPNQGFLEVWWLEAWPCSVAPAITMPSQVPFNWMQLYPNTQCYLKTLLSGWLLTSNFYISHSLQLQCTTYGLLSAILYREALWCNKKVLAELHHIDNPLIFQGRKASASSLPMVVSSWYWPGCP